MTRQRSCWALPLTRRRVSPGLYVPERGCQPLATPVILRTCSFRAFVRRPPPEPAAQGLVGPHVAFRAAKVILPPPSSARDGADQPQEAEASPSWPGSPLPALVPPPAGKRVGLPGLLPLTHLMVAVSAAPVSETWAPPRVLRIPGGHPAEGRAQGRPGFACATRPSSMPHPGILP